MARAASGDDMLIARLNAAAGHEIKRRDSRSAFRPVAVMHPTELRATAEYASFTHHSASSVIDTCASLLFSHSSNQRRYYVFITNKNAAQKTYNISY